MTRADVKAVLQSIGTFKWAESLYGFDLPAPVIARSPGQVGYKSRPDYRISKGSGIAADNRWSLRAVQGDDLARVASTRRQLRTILIEWLTEQDSGPKPVPRPGYRVYAQMHHNLNGSFYIWCYRRTRRP